MAVDSLLLAAAVPLHAGDGGLILDMGCGVGAIMLAVGVRCPEVQVTGIELHPPIAALCRDNIMLNGFQERAEVEEGDIKSLPQHFVGQFDHVVSNPPFHDPKGHTASPDAYRKLALMESEEAGALAQWVGAGYRALKEGGMLTMIFRADREDELIEAIQEAEFAKISIREILSKEGAAPKRIILHAVKQYVENTESASGKYQIQSKDIERKNPFILYNGDGKYSDMAEAVLRGALSMTEAMGE